jgi:hypothetical protein
MSFLDDAKIPIPCPGCGRKTEKTVRWLMHNGQFTCSCGAVVKLDSGKFRQGVARADRAVEDLKRTLK